MGLKGHGADERKAVYEVQARVLVQQHSTEDATLGIEIGSVQFYLSDNIGRSEKISAIFY